MTDYLTPPPDALQAPSGPVWLNEDGIIITLNNYVTHSEEDAIENLRLTKQIAGEVRRPLLVDITNVRNMSKEARDQYTSPDNKSFITSVALITTSNVGKMIGNLFIALHKHNVPVKMFTEIDKASSWLKQYK